MLTSPVPDEVIQSRQNPRVQALARLRDRAEREARGLFIAEGLRELSRAIERKVEVLEIYFCPSMFRGSEAAELVTNARAAGIDCCELGESAFAKVSGREGPDGLLGVARGQSEAALALGMRPRQILFSIILPQAMRVIIPPTANQFISMLKDSSLISVMGVWEVMFLAQSYGRSSYRYLEMLTTAAVIYWVLSILLELLQARLERHFGKAYQR